MHQSMCLTRTVTEGATELTSLAFQKVAENINDVEEFGDLPPPVMHRLSQILSRRRAVTPRTLDLFLRPDHKEINIYDCASEFSRD